MATLPNKAYMAGWFAVIFAALFVLPVMGISPQGSEYLRKARVFFASDDYRMALDYLQRARQLDPTAPEIEEFAPQLQKKIDERVKELRQRADFFLESKNLPEAEKLFSEVLTLAASDEHSLARLKEITSTYKQIDEFKNQGIDVQSSTGRSHDVDMYSAVSFMNRAQGFFAQGDRGNALDMVEKVLKREPGYKPALALKERILDINRLESFVEKAETAFLEGRMRETVDSLNKLIREMPDRHEFILMRAKAFLKLKNFAAAEKDLWKYYRLKREPASIFPLLSEASFGQQHYLNAYAFSFDPSTREPLKSLGYRFRCHFFAFPMHYGLIGAFLALIPFAIYFTWNAAEALFFEKFSISSLGLAISCMITILFKSPEQCLGNLIVVARDMNIAWINYLTGITLFKAGQIEGAQRFLAFSFTNETIRPRAYYFHGLARKLLKHNLYELDFEEAVLSGLGRHKSGWHPNFVKQIERQLLISYSKDKSDETFEGMAFKLVEDVTGG
ncbi:MAG TPA: hypothetical protein PLM07_06275 [Candidatus Rifleibacterium sp.]|nr:hypothetical protein [Candidatus Rifleibacterium sp.]HPT45487.1 hypothetical protein [Candidatus Rifleibacterium sp.]